MDEPIINIPPCYGNYLSEQCNGRHQECRVGGYHYADGGYNCGAHTNKTIGECDCEFKERCHLGRQMTAFRPKENCDVWYYFVNGHWEDSKPLTEIRLRKPPFWIDFFNWFRGDE